ncbi:MAG TPA: ATP-binding protein [Polyangiaceae bacterium]|nr:ATP-binding protein [Polyangiaceae bacterium]
MQSLDLIARDVLDSLQEGCLVIDFDWKFLYVNDAGVRHCRVSRERLIGRPVMECFPGIELQPFFPLLRRSMQSRSLEQTQIEFLFEGDSPAWFDFRMVPIPEGICLITLETTHERQAGARLRGTEDQLRQSQKMEAVGLLAGGVAHDFNNLLSVILCYGELAVARLSPEQPLCADIQEMIKAATRAAELTRQLLMFSRQQVLEPKVLDLNELLTSMEKMLRRILGADVDLLARPAATLARVRVDPSSLEQVIMNLVVNARDAMPTGGKLTMETADVFLDEDYAKRHLGVTPGPHVMLAISDTGRGIDKLTQSRVFEPFFTTKEKGKGTGLGLSTVFGIVKQSGGSIWLYSELGRGTTFKVYLPSVDRPKDSLLPVEAPGILRGSETILLIEDDEQVRAVTGSILRNCGYQVIEARSAADALLSSEELFAPIDLLLADVIMPELSGPELARLLAPSRPEMKVLFMSGYTDASIVRHGMLSASMSFLAKPITVATLTVKVREVLDATLHPPVSDA